MELGRSAINLAWGVVGKWEVFGGQKMVGIAARSAPCAAGGSKVVATEISRTTLAEGYYRA